MSALTPYGATKSTDTVSEQTATYNKNFSGIASKVTATSTTAGSTTTVKSTTVATASLPPSFTITQTREHSYEEFTRANQTVNPFPDRLSEQGSPREEMGGLTIDVSPVTLHDGRSQPNMTTQQTTPSVVTTPKNRPNELHTPSHRGNPIFLEPPREPHAPDAKIEGLQQNAQNINAISGTKFFTFLPNGPLHPASR